MNVNIKKWMLNCIQNQNFLKCYFTITITINYFSSSLHFLFMKRTSLLNMKDLHFTGLHVTEKYSFYEKLILHF